VSVSISIRSTWYSPLLDFCRLGIRSRDIFIDLLDGARALDVKNLYIGRFDGEAASESAIMQTSPLRAIHGAARDSSLVWKFESPKV
jgi:hypothetical protein